jgi:hypothetical protein
VTCPECDSVERSLGKRWRLLAGFIDEWWRVAAYRAWIGTLSLIAIAALLTLPSQTRDILSGIGETLTLGGQGMLSPGFRWDGVTAYTALWLAGLFLALALALVVRVTGLLEFGHPYHVVPEHDERRRRVVLDYSALTFVGALSVVHLTYLSASANLYEAGAVMAIVSALVLIPWFLLNRWNVSRAWRIGVYLVIAALIACYTFYGTYSRSDERIVADMVSCATPALALIAILSRGLPFPVRDNRSTALLIILASLPSLLVLTLVVETPWPPGILYALYRVGIVPVVFVWLAWLASALAFGLLVAHRLSRWSGRPDVVFILTIAVIILAYSFHHEKPGQEWLGPKPPDAATADAQVTLPNAAPATPKSSGAVAPSRTQLAIHADGGGLRAALFTAEVLAIADDLTCGDFGSHVFAASGVSGGSLGIATWAVMRAEVVRLEKEKKLQPGNRWADCKQQREKAGIQEGHAHRDGTRLLGPRPLWTLVLDTLLQDHLTVALTSMLTADFLRLRGNAQRGQAMLDSWQGAALDTLGQIETVDPKTGRAFAAKLGASKAGFDSGGPILLFTATAVDTGDRFVFSNADWPPYNAFSNIPIGVAVLDSARFPLISPAGAHFVIPPAGAHSRPGRTAPDSGPAPRRVVSGKWRRVADGGYFDNSGAATLRDMLIEAKRGGRLIGKVIVARINGNALSSKDDARCDEFSDAAAKKGWWVGLPRHGTTPKKDDELPSASLPQYSGWSAIDTYTATRSAHSEEEVQILDEQATNIVDRVVKPQLRLDYFDGFDENCAATLPENHLFPVKKGDGAPSSSGPPRCLNQNVLSCLLGRNSPKAPLGWYLSRGSGAAMESSAETAAARLLKATDEW